jgi:hypothetical protein
MVKKCEGCGLKVPNFGLAWLPSEGRLRFPSERRWCAGCAKAHAGPTIQVVNSTRLDVASRKCEGCGLKLPKFGLAWLPSEGRLRFPSEMRWCAGCAKAHVGAVDVASRKCECCGLKQPNFGLPSEGKRRWCAGCAKGHEGAVDVSSQKCEGCGLKSSSFGLPGDGKKKRWCAGCAKGHPGAVDRRGRGPKEKKQKARGSPQKKPKVTDGPSVSILGVSS